nr:retrovirus-related Pol polyprotein from transposon TNT 1-94 [Tanacetum cinerariifolium]
MLKDSSTDAYKSFEELWVEVEQQRTYALGKSKAEIGSTKSLLKKEFDMKDLRKAKNILGMEIIRDRSRKILRVSQSGRQDMYKATRSYALGKSKVEIGSTKSLLKKEFDMKDLRKAKNILGMEIVRDRSRKILRVSQSGYVSKILNNFRIHNEKSVKMPFGGHFKLSIKDCSVRDYVVERTSKVPYINVVGSLMYLLVCTRLDIAYAVSVVSRYLANLDKNHWEAVKWILNYLRGTAKVGLVYATNHGNHVDVIGFVDSDYAKEPDKEAKYMALTEAVNEAIWLRGLLEELGVELNTVAVNCDNQGAIHLSWNHGAIHLSWNHVFHDKTKHINVRYHFSREVLEAKTVKVLNVGTGHNVVDALTNVVKVLRWKFLCLVFNLGKV